MRDNNGKPVPNDWVTIDIYHDDDEDSYVSYYLKTNSYGQIRLSCNFRPGSYSVDVEDDYDYNFADVVVRKLTPKLFAANRVVKVKTKIKTYTMTLKNNKNQVMRNMKVTLRVYGKTYVAKPIIMVRQHSR